MSAPGVPDPRHDAAFAGVVLLLREIAHGLLGEGRLPEARGIVDGIASLRAKAAGNLAEEEERFLDGLLYELRMAVVKAPPAAPDPAPDPPAASPESP